MIENKRMKDNIFFDTNIILYLLSGERPEALSKFERALSLASEGGVISVQVLTETTNVLRKKSRAEWKMVNDFLAVIQSIFKVIAISNKTFALAQKIAETHQFHIYDSMIIAAASEYGCNILYSEDMQHGFKFRNLSIVNPFI